jgi:hypothetical protein
MSLESKAWLRHGFKGLGLTTKPALLTARGGRVNFATAGGTVFEADRHEIRVNWPWWEMGAGVHLTVSGKIYRLTFVRPQESEMDIAGFLAARAAGKAWKACLGADKAN